MFDQYGDGIISIIFGNMSAKEAVSKCEKSPLEELRAILGADLDPDTDMDAAIARLAERLGIATNELSTDEDSQLSSDAGAEIKTDLFGSKGGNN